MEDFVTIQCPHCAQLFPLEMDVSAGNDQVFVIDCEVCCRPIQVHACVDASGEIVCETSAER